MIGDAYTESPAPKEGDTLCVACGGVLDPLQTMLSNTGRHWSCDRAATVALMKNRMVAP